MLLDLCFCIALHDERGEVLIKWSWSYAFVCCCVTLHDERRAVLLNRSRTYAFE